MSTEPVVHVIDDDDAARDSLKFLIECAGYRVADYDSALAFLAALPANGKLGPGCIVTDVRMPEMTGLELVNLLKAKGVAEPIVVITGHADVPMAIQAMKGGVTDFIEKPFADDAILSVIREALDKRSAEVEADAEGQEIVQKLASLSQREREVLDRLVEGKANKIIAFELGISVRTVEVYRANVMSKMQVKSLSQLVRMALGV
jgi:two-component system response regulator FixJ